MVLTFESVDEILKCDHSNEMHLATLSLSYCQFFSFLASRNLNKCDKFILYADTDDHVFCNWNPNPNGSPTGFAVPTPVL